MYRVNWSSLYKYTYIEGLVNILPALYVYIYIYIKEKTICRAQTFNGFLRIINIIDTGKRWIKLYGCRFIYKLCYASVCESSIIIILTSSNTFHRFKRFFSLVLQRRLFVVVNNLFVCVCVLPEHTPKGCKLISMFEI